MSRGRRLALVIGLVGALGLGLAGCSFSHSHEPATTKSPTSISSQSIASPEVASSAEEQFLMQTGNSLIALHQDSDGGWKFQSQIQAPHFQTDRDVGAASVGMGFLMLADRYPGNPQWLTAARKTADWLMAVETKHPNSTISWPDYVDNSGAADTTYTSVDDGAMGDGYFFWQLYKKTGDTAYKDTALAAVNWTLDQAENTGSASQPVYRWKWGVSTDNNSKSSDNPPVYSMGMGMGVVGLVETLATYYDQTKTSDPVFAARCKQYIDGALRFIQQRKATLAANGGDSRALPETGVSGQDGDTSEDSGYLSGSAGDAFMYLKLYQVFRDPSYLAQANQAFSWLQDTKSGPMVQFGDGTVAWQIAVDPQDQGDPANTPYATGIEEGSAGIGWTYLQAYNLTGDKSYLAIAEKAAGWLMNVAVKDPQGGWSWHEDEHPASSYIHPNLDNGAAGIGIFFYDLYAATRDPRYLTATQGAARYLMNTAVHNGNNLSWTDTDDGRPFSDDPAWHWGIAGIINFFVRISGGRNDIPGEQQGLTRLTSP